MNTKGNEKTLTYKFSFWNTDNCFMWYYIRGTYRSIAWAVILVILIISVIAIGIATTAIYDLLKQGMNINMLTINGEFRFSTKARPTTPILRRIKTIRGNEKSNVQRSLRVVYEFELVKQRDSMQNIAKL